MTGQTEINYKNGGLRAGTSEQLSQWGSTGGRPVKWTEEALIQLGNELIEWLSVEGEPGENVFFGEFLIKRGFYNDLINKYTSESKAFFEIIQTAKKIQEYKLAKGGLTGKHRDAMSIFLLKNYHNMADRVEQSNTKLPLTINLNVLPPGQTPKQVEYQEQQEMLPEATDINLELPFELLDKEPGKEVKDQQNASNGVLPDNVKDQEGSLDKEIDEE